MIGQHLTTEMMQTTPVNEVVGNPGTAVITPMEKRGVITILTGIKK